MVQRISLAFKIILSSLFGVLLLFEVFDGVHDIADWSVSFFFILMLNDTLINYREAKGRAFRTWSLSPRDAGNKFLVSGLFLAILSISILIEYTDIMTFGSKALLYNAMASVWAAIYLGVNIYKLKASFNFQRLFIANVAFAILVGSIVLN